MVPLNYLQELKRLVLLPLFILLGCQSNIANESDYVMATEGYSKEQTDKLFVVDCLLPPQLRRLGSQMTYLTARRPIQTTAGDCEIRGGEYIAYDRANYASSLKVWLPQAKSGSAKAQVIIGEIFENGLGSTLVDMASAAQWYRKSAEQGNSRAQINLGHLYEKGLGVKKNLPEALNWYRKASGLDGSDLAFESVTIAAVSATHKQEMADLMERLNRSRNEAKLLRQSFNKMKRKFAQQDKALINTKNALESSKRRLSEERDKKEADQQLIQRMEKDLQNKQKNYNSRASELTALQNTINKSAQDSLSAYYTQIDNLQQQLKLKKTEYSTINTQITKDMQQVKVVATTTQEKLAIERLRQKIELSKAALLKTGKRIKSLKNDLAENQKTVSRLEKEGRTTFAQSGIEIIEPSMFLTRGTPSYQLRSIQRSKKIVGKIVRVKDLLSLTVNGKSIQSDKKGVFQQRVDINGALNPVEIIANYKRGKPSKLTFNLLAKGAESAVQNETLISRPSSTVYKSVNFGRFYALVIGNKDYTQLPALKTSENDAREVADVLRQQYGYKTTLLINANRHQVMTAFNDLRKVLTEEDNLLIYYAGHGEIDKSDQSAYWLPTDAERDNTANWLSSHSITQYLSVLEARHILVVADSCYSGAMTTGSIAALPEQMADTKRKKWLQFMVKRKARTVMTSGGEKPVLDSGGGQHSVFAKAFIDVLKKNKGLMEDYELFRAVSGQVEKSASSIGFEQSPQYSAMLHAGHEGSPFFFVPQ